MVGSDRQRVDGIAIQTLLEWELSAFMAHYEETPMTEEQDLRAYLINWFAAFAPEACSPEFQATLEEFLQECRDRADFSIEGWWKLTTLDVALYLLTADTHWLDVCRANLDHHRSELRTSVMYALALAAPRLAFDEEMLNRTARNVSQKHFWCEDLVVLFACSQGVSEFKIRQISEWLSGSTHNPGVERTLSGLAEGEAVANPFLSHLLWLQQYCSMRLLSDSWTDGFLTKQALQRRQQPRDRWQRRLFETDLAFDELWHRIRGHPLMVAEIKVEPAPCPSESVNATTPEQERDGTH